MLEYLLREIKHGAESEGITKQTCSNILAKVKAKSKAELRPGLTDSYNRRCNGCGHAPIHKSNTSGLCIDCFVELKNAVDNCKSTRSICYKEKLKRKEVL